MRSIFLIAFGAALTFAGIAAFNFGCSFPTYYFRPLDMGADSYCLLGTLLLGTGAILYVIGTLLHFAPPGESIPPSNGAIPAAILIGSLIIGVGLGLGSTTSSTAGPGRDPRGEEVLRIQNELMQRQQEAMQGKAFPGLGR